MSKHHKLHKKEKFKPKIGFENSIDSGLSFSFSELDLQVNPQKPNSFFSESDKEGGKDFGEKSESVPEANESNGLNHAFFEENSESVTIEAPIKLVKELNENTKIEHSSEEKLRKSESDVIEGNEIILSYTESPLKKEKSMKVDENIRNQVPKNKKNCCKCASCYVF